ncbi:Glucosylglycerate phosphorylase [Actinosynnema sp. ALI-1.44]
MDHRPWWVGEDLLAELTAVYGRDGVAWLLSRLDLGRADSASRRRSPPGGGVLVSCYPDHLPDGPGTPAGATLRGLRRRLAGLRELVVHLLPPYLTDPEDRFSLIDDSTLDPALAGWDDLVSSGATLALDLIVNQLSTNSAQYRSFTAGAEPPFFYLPDPDFDFSRLTSPRGREVLRTVRRGDREVRVWSAHGGRQVDLDYRSPAVLLWTTQRLRRLAAVARDVRLDGIAFSWKESGTSCANLPTARTLCDFLSGVWHAVRPDGRVIAEVDLYDDDRAYVRPGSDEGPDLVYDYEFPRCAAIALVLGDTGPLADEVRRLSTRQRGHWCTMVVTHDGLSLRPWVPARHRQLLDRLVRVLVTTGVPVHHVVRDGEELPYEVNALPADLDRPAAAALDVARPHCAVMAMSLVATVRGTPMVYLPALLGVVSTPVPAGIDPRERIRRPHLPDAAGADHGLMVRMLELRSSSPVLDAASPMRLLRDEAGLLVFTRGPNGELVVVHNFSARQRTVAIARPGVDLLTRRRLDAGAHPVAPRQVLWIRLDDVVTG